MAPLFREGPNVLEQSELAHIHTVDGVPWNEFKITFMHDPCWARKDWDQSLSDEERRTLTRLIDAQKEFS